MCLIAVLGFTAAGPVAAQGKRKLGAIEKEIKLGQRRAIVLRRKDSGLKNEISRLRARIVDSTQSVRAGAAALSRLKKKLARSKRQAASARRAIRSRRAEMAAILAALQRLSLRPPEALIASPREANTLVRGGLVLRATLPVLERKIVAVERRAALLASARAAGVRQRSGIRRTTARLERDRARLLGLLGKRRSLRRQTARQQAQAKARLRALAAEASSLRDLLHRVRRQAKARPAAGAGNGRRPNSQHPNSRLRAIRAFTSVGARITLPVRGRIIRRFGKRVNSGARSKGIVIRARPGARVVATFDGRVVFAGPFRDYGQILIIAHGGGYHTLIAGPWRIKASVNQWLMANEPVGAMSLTQSGNTKLYLEMRRNGQPINPLPLVAAKNRRR
ncbi:MAG: murein hydrolase activator EnvC family protein [Alphaproteobacteria bacterium]